MPRSVLTSSRFLAIAVALAIVAAAFVFSSCGCEDCECDDAGNGHTTPVPTVSDEDLTPGGPSNDASSDAAATVGASGSRAYILDWKRTPTLPENWKSPEPGWDFLVLDLAIENAAPSPVLFPSDDGSIAATATSDAGYAYDPVSSYLMVLPPTDLSDHWPNNEPGLLAPGCRRRFSLVFEVPVNQSGFTVQIAGLGSFDSSDATRVEFPSSDFDSLPRSSMIYEPEEEWRLSLGSGVRAGTEGISYNGGSLGPYPGNKCVLIPATIENTGGYDLQAEVVSFTAIDNLGFFHKFGPDRSLPGTFYPEAAPGMSSSGDVFFCDVHASVERLALIITAGPADDPAALVDVVAIEVP